MKKTLLTIMLCGIMILGLTGCGNSKSVLGGDEPLKNPANVIFTIQMGSKVCVPVTLAVYDDGTYELFTEYETCRPGKTCASMLKYTKSIKGEYDYDVKKIIENSVDADSKGYSMDNLPEYEMYMGSSYVEQGYSYHYTVEKGQTNKYLDEFLNKIDIDLKVCAEPKYID